MIRSKGTQNLALRNPLLLHLAMQPAIIKRYDSSLRREDVASAFSTVAPYYKQNCRPLPTRAHLLLLRVCVTVVSYVDLPLIRS